MESPKDKHRSKAIEINVPPDVIAGNGSKCVSIWDGRRMRCSEIAGAAASVEATFSSGCVDKMKA